MKASSIGFYAGIALFIIILIAPLSVTASIQVTLALAALMATWWLTEAVPIAVTSLLPLIILPLFGVMNGKEVAKMYANDIIFLFLGGFMVAMAIQKWNLHKRLSLKIISVTGSSASMVLLGFMIATSFLSMWISNTATTMMMIPIAMSLTAHTGDENKKFATGLFMGIAYAASIGGITTLIGTPPNMVFVKVFDISFPGAPDISFTDWLIFALPLGLLLFAITYFLIRLFYVKSSPFISKDKINDLTSQMGKTSYEEKTVLIIFVLMALFWIFRKKIEIGSMVIHGWSELLPNPSYINDGTVAIFFAILLFLIPAKSQKGQILDWKTTRQLPWNVVLLFGGGFALAEAFVKSGLTKWLAGSLTALSGTSPIIIILAITTLVALITQLTSDTSTAQIVLPILAGMAIAIKINPVLIMIPATFASSTAFMTPVATPPNAIAYGTGQIKMTDLLKTGGIINLIGIVLITLLVYYWAPVVLHVSFSKLPLWVR